MSTRDLTRISFFTALIAVMAYVSIPLPFSPVPITGQTLAVMLAGSVLTAGQAFWSVLVFLLLGIAGAPVFSGGAAGLGILVGKTGGYLFGFLFGAMAVSLIRGKGNNLFRLFAANIVGGVVVIYIFGVSWLSYITGLDLGKAFVLGAVPFLIGDIIKVIIASLAGYRLNKYFQSRNNQ